MNKNEDILASLDVFETESTQEIEENSLLQRDIFFKQENLSPAIEENETQEAVLMHNIEEEKISQDEAIVAAKRTNPEKKQNRFLTGGIFMVKYISSSLVIFGVLMLVSNYSAYYKIAHSYIFAEEITKTKQSLIESVAAAEVKTQDMSEDFSSTFKEEEEETESSSFHDINEFAPKSAQDIELGIEITPYENRIIIPKIGKNIPLLDIKQQRVEGVSELNAIFMDELHNGVVRYPTSAKPGEDGNTFIFGHSSNFPWIKGDYNDVFALLDKVVYDDEVIVYYGQEKYTYKITKKSVIRPGDTSVLKQKDDRSTLTLMTCWPIGTTLNRLVVTGELVTDND